MIARFTLCRVHMLMLVIVIVVMIPCVVAVHMCPLQSARRDHAVEFIDLQRQ